MDGAFLAKLAGDPVLIAVRDRLAEILSGPRQTEWPDQSECPGVLVALSGGPDSTALLLALAGTGVDASPRFAVQAMHVNHGLRGAESDSDEQFCQELCQDLGVPFASCRLEGAGGSEDSWRQARYEALAERALRLGAQAIVTGHTLDDQVETMLFRLFRGTGPAGLTGIPVSRLLADGRWGNLRLVRPLLSLRKQDCLDALARVGASWRTDSSNAQTRHARNYIRQEIVGTIEERFRGFPERMEQLRSLVSADEELLETLAAEAEERCLAAAGQVGHAGAPAVVFSLPVFQSVPLSLRRRLIARQLRKLGVEVSFERVEQILQLAAGSSGAVSLDENFDVRCRPQALIFQAKNQPLVADGDNQLTFAGCQLQVPGVTNLPEIGWQVEIKEWQPGEGVEMFPPAQALEALADLAAVRSPLEVRLRRPGDVICPFGFDRPVRLKQYLRTHKSGSSAMGDLGGDSPPEGGGGRVVWVVADREEVIWVPGVGLSEKVRVQHLPSHKLKVVDLRQAQLLQER